MLIQLLCWLLFAMHRKCIRVKINITYNFKDPECLNTHVIKYESKVHV